MKVKRFGGSVLVKFRRVGIRFEKGNMEDGMKTRKIGWETELIGKRRDFTRNGKGTESTVVEFVRGTSGFDVTTKKPNKLIRLVVRCVGNVLVVLVGLNSLRVF